MCPGRWNENSLTFFTVFILKYLNLNIDETYYRRFKRLQRWPECKKSLIHFSSFPRTLSLYVLCQGLSLPFVMLEIYHARSNVYRRHLRSDCIKKYLRGNLTILFVCLKKPRRGNKDRLGIERHRVRFPDSDELFFVGLLV